MDAKFEKSTPTEYTTPKRVSAKPHGDEVRPTPMEMAPNYQESFFFVLIHVATK
jgi:hypothetical protein